MPVSAGFLTHDSLQPRFQFRATTTTFFRATSSSKLLPPPISPILRNKLLRGHHRGPSPMWRPLQIALKR